MDPGAINLVYKKKKKKRFAATKQYLLFPSLSVAGYGCQALQQMKNNMEIRKGTHIWMKFSNTTSLPLFFYFLLFIYYYCCCPFFFWLQPLHPPVSLVPGYFPWTNSSKLGIVFWAVGHATPLLYAGEKSKLKIKEICVSLQKQEQIVSGILTSLLYIASQGLLLLLLFFFCRLEKLVLFYLLIFGSFLFFSVRWAFMWTMWVISPIITHFTQKIK